MSFRRGGVTRLSEHQTRLLSVAHVQLRGLSGGKQIRCAKFSGQQFGNAHKAFFGCEVLRDVPIDLPKNERESMTRTQCDRADQHVVHHSLRATRTAQGQLYKCPVADCGGEQFEPSLFGIRHSHTRMIVHTVVRGKGTDENFRIDQGCSRTVADDVRRRTLARKHFRLLTSVATTLATIPETRPAHKSGIWSAVFETKNTLARSVVR